MTIIYQCTIDEKTEINSEKYESLVDKYTKQVKRNYAQSTPKFTWEIKNNVFQMKLIDGLEPIVIEGPPLD